MNVLNNKSQAVRIFMLISLLWFSDLALRAADRYVVEPGTITNGHGGVYTSWDIAATQIQWAVDVAANAGDTVLVSNGVYVLTNQIVVTNAITLRSTNGPNVTVINGGFVAGGATTNNRCLWMSNASAFVSGFTFSNGAVIDQDGAGVWMYSGTLSNCHVCTNTVFVSGSGGSDGGGIYAYDSTATVTACRVFGNLVNNLTNGYGGGAGICMAKSLVSDCVISNNYVLTRNSNSSGGGVKLSDRGAIRSSMICNNNIPNGFAGGISVSFNGLMEGCTVTVNSATYDGGGISLAGGTITNCVISYNTAAGYGLITAGGIRMKPVWYPCYMYNTTIISNNRAGVRMDFTYFLDNHAINCVIKDNTSYGVTMTASTNAGLYNCEVRGNKGGGINFNSGILHNCLIDGNTNNGTCGGLLISSDCQTGIVNSCTITSNRSTSAGAGIRIEATNANILSVSSCIIYSNGAGGTDDVYDAASPANIGVLQYSCVGTNPGFTGAGIIVANPQFKNFTGGDYRLSANSPCVNTGTNQGWMANSYDLDGHMRIRYGTVDMGAYETIYNGAIYSFGF